MGANLISIQKVILGVGVSDVTGFQHFSSLQDIMNASLRFDCLSAPSDPCCSRSKRQIQAYDAPTFKSFEEEKLLPARVQLFEEEEEPSSLQSLHHLPLR